MSSEARQKLKENKKDIEALWGLHTEKSGATKGRKYGVEVLNKSVIVFVCAAWEAYCEDVLLEAVVHLSNDCTHIQLPEKVKAIIGEGLQEDKNLKAPWSLAGEGWKTCFQENAEIRVNKLNTPNPNNLEKLFEQSLGLKGLCETWKWQGCSNTQAKNKLIGFIKLRGAIAHRLKPDKAVHKKSGKEFFSHISIIADFIDETVSDHLTEITGKHYW